VENNPTKAVPAAMPSSADPRPERPGSIKSLLYLGLRKAEELRQGIALTGAIAAASMGIHALPGLALFSPLIISMVAGLAVRNLIGMPDRVKPGVTFATRKVLRVAIVLLGFQLTIAQILEVGATSVMVIATTLAAAFLFTIWFGRLLRVERQLAELIAAGTSICGASAVIAVNAVTDAGDEDVAYAVACVTVFGSLAMLIYPLLPGLLRLNPLAYGLWSGASIHEIAQVVAATFQHGRTAGEFGTIAKLTRVMMLAPVVLILGALAKRRKPTQRGASAPMPLFVLGFVVLVVLNSFVAVPAGTKMWLATGTTYLLAVALAAMGLETDVAKLRAKGLRPLLLGAAASLFIASFSLVLVKLTL
jgi:uncharacterized integral membrane protein (TIGR00698 family)